MITRYYTKKFKNKVSKLFEKHNIECQYVEGKYSLMIFARQKGTEDWKETGFYMKKFIKSQLKYWESLEEDFKWEIEHYIKEA